MAGAWLKTRPPVVPVWVGLELTRVWLDSFAGPVLRLVAKLVTVTGPASSRLLVVVEGSAKLGASLTATTVIVKTWAAEVLTFGETLLPLSVRVTLKVAVPLLL